MTYRVLTKQPTDSDFHEKGPFQDIGYAKTWIDSNCHSWPDATEVVVVDDKNNWVKRYRKVKDKIVTEALSI